MSLTIDISPTIQSLGKAVSPASVDTLLRNIAQGLLGEIRTRIHEQGQNAKGSQIGTYSKAYLKRRIKAGKTASTKVVLSYTRQMQNDWKVIPLGGSYGLGFSNSLNADKADWMQERFGKIYALTPSEQKQMEAIISDWLDNLL
jgi:hypothetical protein